MWRSFLPCWCGLKGTLLDNGSENGYTNRIHSVFMIKNYIACSSIINSPIQENDCRQGHRQFFTTNFVDYNSLVTLTNLRPCRIDSSQFTGSLHKKLCSQELQRLIGHSLLPGWGGPLTLRAPIPLKTTLITTKLNEFTLVWPLIFLSARTDAVSWRGVPLSQWEFKVDLPRPDPDPTF